MDEKKRMALEILEKYHQEHLLEFYTELNNSERDALLEQILSIDFEKIFALYEASKTDDVLKEGERISPIPIVDALRLSAKEKQHFQELSSACISSGAYAIVTMAGGQGSRLGIAGPKGTFEVETVPKKSLFAFIAEQIHTANALYQTHIPWYIMTSTANDYATRQFFKMKKFFGLSPSDVTFFMQEDLPIIDIQANLMLEETYKVKVGSNGNGDVFRALAENGLLADMKRRHITWIIFGGIDNILFRYVDPIFLGFVIHSGYSIGSKSVLQEKENDWVFAKRNGKPTLIPTSLLPQNLLAKRNDFGEALYGDVNILSHLFSIEALEKLATVSFPYNRAFKRTTFVNEEGMKEVPAKPNSFKFENFIFDAFPHFEDIAVLRVPSNEEFAPIKSFTGQYTPETALELYLKMKNRG